MKPRTALRFVTLIIALVGGVRASTECDGLTGWRRIVQLYAGHWDAVSLVSFSGSASDASKKLVKAVECGVPLALTQWGVSKPTKCDGWYSPTGGCQAGTYAKSSGTVPAWKRFEGESKTRLQSFPTVPNVTATEWLPNQHESPTLRPADVVVYDMDGLKAADALAEHVNVQLSELTHAVLVFGDVCSDSSPVRKAMFAVSNDDHKIHELYCREDDVSGSQGLLLMRKVSKLEFHGGLVKFESNLGAPKSLTGKELFTALADSNHPGVIFQVPDTCIHRLTTNPLQRVFWADDAHTELKSEPHTGVDPKYLDRLHFRTTTIGSSASFRNTFYSGIYCGATAFTVAVVTTGQKLFYTIATPVVAAVADLGIPTLFRYDNVQFRPRVPLLSLYFHYELPKPASRERRYLAYQLEYAPNKIRDKHNLQFLQGAVVPMEYTQDQLQQWKDRGVDNVQQLPLCYHPSIEYVLPTASTPKYNALFPGIINGKPRREAILEDLKGNGVKVQFRSYLRGGDQAPKFGVEDVIDAFNSEMVLNFHAYSDSGVAQLEVPRLTPYLSNGVFIISEQGVEREQRRKLDKALIFVPDGVPMMNSTLVKKWVGPDNADRRAKVARQGQNIMKKEFRCEKHAAFVASMDAIATNAYPSWFVDSFYDRADML